MLFVVDLIFKLNASDSDLISNLVGDVSKENCEL